jgi:hypothetical protein
MRILMRIVAGSLGVFLVYAAWSAFFDAPWETPLRRALFSLAALGLACQFIPYAISSTYGKSRGGKSTSVRFKDPNA